MAKREIEVQGEFWAMGMDRRHWWDEPDPFPVKILVAPGRTEKPTDRQLREIERSQPLLEMACRAEEIFDLDYLERFAAGREK